MHSFGIQQTFAFNFNCAVQSIFIDVFNQQQLQLSDISQKAILLELSSFKFYCIAPTDTPIYTHIITHSHTHVLTPINKVSFVMIYAFCCLWDDCALLSAWRACLLPRPYTLYSACVEHLAASVWIQFDWRYEFLLLIPIAINLLLCSSYPSWKLH